MVFFPTIASVLCQASFGGDDQKTAVASESRATSEPRGQLMIGPYLIVDNGDEIIGEQDVVIDTTHRRITDAYILAGIRSDWKEVQDYVNQEFPQNADALQKALRGAGQLRFDAPEPFYLQQDTRCFDLHGTVEGATVCEQVVEGTAVQYAQLSLTNSEPFNSVNQEFLQQTGARVLTESPWNGTISNCHTYALHQATGALPDMNYNMPFVELYAQKVNGQIEFEPFVRSAQEQLWEKYYSPVAVLTPPPFLSDLQARLLAAGNQSCGTKVGGSVVTSQVEGEMVLKHVQEYGTEFESWFTAELSGLSLDSKKIAQGKYVVVMGVRASFVYSDDSTHTGVFTHPIHSGILSSEQGGGGYELESKISSFESVVVGPVGMQYGLYSAAHYLENHESIDPFILILEQKEEASLSRDTLDQLLSTQPVAQNVWIAQTINDF